MRLGHARQTQLTVNNKEIDVMKIINILGSPRKKHPAIDNTGKRLRITHFVQRYYQNS